MLVLSVLAVPLKGMVMAPPFLIVGLVVLGLLVIGLALRRGVLNAEADADAAGLLAGLLFALLVLAAGLQWADAGPLRRMVGASVAGPGTAVLDLAAWRAILPGLDQVVVDPPSACLPRTGRGGGVICRDGPDVTPEHPDGGAPHGRGGRRGAGAVARRGA